MFAGGGCGADGVRLLKEETVALMMEPQFTDAPSHDAERGTRDQAMVWHCECGRPCSASRDSRLVLTQLLLSRADTNGFLGHSGGDPGVSTYMGFVPDGEEQGTGIVMLSTLSSDEVTANGGSLAEQALREYAKSL